MIPKSVLFQVALTKGGAAMLMILWWVFVIGCLTVWAAGVAYLSFVMASDAAKGERIAWSEIFMTFIWPIELAKILFIAIMIASDDRLG